MGKLSLFTVDTEKCKRDGICAAECPARIIKIGKHDKIPSWVEDAESYCINCGHCVAVCPYGALSLKNSAPEECLTMEKELLPNSDQVRHLLLSRRSIRRYKNKPVKRDTLLELIDVARYGPTASNLQPVRWLVIEEASEVQRFAGLVIEWMDKMLKEQAEEVPPRFQQLVNDWEKGEDRICRGAPHIIVTYAHKSFAYARTDCAIALTYLELSAYSMGLGTCWDGYLYTAANAYPPIREALGISEEHQVLGALMVGYPKYRYHRVPKRDDPLITWR